MFAIRRLLSIFRASSSLCKRRLKTNKHGLYFPLYRQFERHMRLLMHPNMQNMTFFQFIFTIMNVFCVRLLFKSTLYTMYNDGGVARRSGDLTPM